jgi:hypothetical protein
MGCHSGNRADALDWFKVYEFTNFVDITTFSYDEDNSLSAPTFSRVLYQIQYDEFSVWVEFDDFTSGDATKVGLPLSWVYDVEVTNLKAYFTNPGAGFPLANLNTIVTKDSAIGKIQFWPSNYSTGADGIYSHDDTGGGTADGYGSMQVFDMEPTIPECVFSWSGWGLTNGGNCGIGSYSGTHTDWTFNYNANDFTRKICRIFIK